MNEPIKTTYREQEITYNESINEWSCDAISRGRKTLVDLKEAIDKKLDAVAKKPFERFRAYIPRFGWRENCGVWPVVEVTSMTDRNEFWISYNGERTKVDQVFLVNPENDAAVNRIRALRLAAKKLGDEISAAEKTMRPWSPA